MKKNISKIIYVLACLIMVIGQSGMTKVFAETVNKGDSPTKQTKVYHDYAEYQKALTEYNSAKDKYDTDLDEYNQNKQDHDDAQVEADRIEQENAVKKADYEKALEQYQKELDEYNKEQDEVNDHSSKGQYTGPAVLSTYKQLQAYIVNYSAMVQMADSGLSISGDPLIAKIQANMAADPFTGSNVVESSVQTVVDQWNVYYEFEKTIQGTAFGMNIGAVTPGAIGGAWYSGFKGVEFYHTFSSTTGQTADNIPQILDHPTEGNIKQAVADLFTKTGGLAFDSANQPMDKDTFMVDQSMFNKWSSAVAEAKSQGFSLYLTAIQQYIDAFKQYNSSNYETADYDTFMAGIDVATKTQTTAMNLIGGMYGVDLEDSDNSVPFYNDLKNLSASDLANKYGYLKLLCNMASEATYGYFHLLTPAPGESLTVAVATSWSNGYVTFEKSKEDHSPKLIPPTEPIPPMYEIVPIVPDEPVPPIPPVQPIYEPLNTVSLLKVDKETRGPLADAKFELKNSSTGVILGTFTSGNDGLINLANLDPGNYTLTEIEAPEGYVLDSTPVAFIVQGTENEKIQLEKANTSITGSVELTKSDEKTKAALQGAVFEIRDTSGTVIRSGLQTNLEGKILVEGLKVGDYSFVETKAPTGYVLDNTPVKFTIEKSQTAAVEVAMTNKLAPGGVVLSKTDSQSGVVLQGAVFELQDKAGKIIQSGLTTDASGKLAVDGLVPGEYQFVETKAPTGYELDQTPVAFAIEKGQTAAVQVAMTNKLTPGGVVLSKTDVQSGDVLQGAVFELQDKAGKVLQSGLTTDASGKLAVAGLAPGEYQFVETQAPTGYDVDSTPVTFTIEKNQTLAVEVAMTNKLTAGGVVLNKTDAKSGDVLQGAVFELQDKAGKVLQRGLTTDVSGKLAVAGLAPGEYQFVETQAPTGYDLDQTPVPFVIEKGQTAAVQVAMTNKPTVGSVVLNKIDAETGDRLAGAIFELRDSNDKVILTNLKTDSNGKLAINDLALGKYQLIETQAPTGYVLDATPIDFVVKSSHSSQEQLTKTNKGKDKTIRIEKRDSRTQAMLAGAQFNLLDSQGKTIQEGLTTDKNGVVAIDGLTEGAYQLVETQAPVGYTLEETAIRFTVEKDSALIKLTKLNVQKDNPSEPENSPGSGVSQSTYSAKSYPNTGEKNSLWFALLGAMIIAVVVGSRFVKRRE